MTLYNTDMQNEKIAIIALGIIIFGALSVFLAATYSEEILNNLFPEEKTIEFGDCADVNYIGKFENGTVFDSSYAYVENKTNGIPLKIFVTMNKSEAPPTDYPLYSSGIIDGFMEGLIGLKAGETATIGPIPPEKAYGVTPKVGDVIDISELAGTTYILKIIQIEENVPMPEDYVQFLGDELTNVYTLKQDWHFIGEIVDEFFGLYPSWNNSSIVTKINETKLWYYTTPSVEIGNNFSWIDQDTSSGFQIVTIYPEESSNIIAINDSEIVIQHNPLINSIISIQDAFGSVTSYTVENITSEKINTSFEDVSTGDKSYVEFDRKVTILRNNSINITVPNIPSYLMEQQLLMLIRQSDPDFKLSLHELSDHILYFEVEIVEVYKTS